MLGLDRRDIISKDFSNTLDTITRYLEIHFDALQLYNNSITIIRMIISNLVKEN